MGIEQIESEALKLARKSRARLAHILLESLDSLSDKENERLWGEEAMRRYADLKAGLSEELSADDVMRETYARLAAKQ